MDFLISNLLQESFFFNSGRGQTENTQIRVWISHCLLTNRFGRCRDYIHISGLIFVQNCLYICSEEPQRGEKCCLSNHQFIAPKVTKSSQKWPNVAKSSQKQPKVAKSSLKKPKVAKITFYIFTFLLVYFPLFLLFLLADVV